MKQLITILLTLFTLISYSQTELDQEIFKVVNEYRISNGLTPWIWSQETFVACEFHNSYQTKIKNIKHHETQNVKSHTEIRTVGKRLESQGIDWSACGENLAVINTTGLSVQEAAVKILKSWIASKPHHELLLEDFYYQYGALSSTTQDDWVGAKYEESVWTYVTLNVYGD